jgi:tetratricopeptide (TPR) repeat protein
MAAGMDSRRLPVPIPSQKPIIQVKRVVHGRTQRIEHCRSTTAPMGLLLMVGLAILASAGCKMSAQGRNVDGVREYQLGRYHESIRHFQRALADDPNNADAYYNLAATYYNLAKRNGDRSLMQQSEGLYHQCLDLNPNHVACYRGLASLLVDTDRQESAFTLVRRWAQRSYGSAEPRIELARLHEEFGDKDAAIQHLTDALHVDANNARAWTALGRLRENRGEFAQALSNYQQAYNINQFQPGVGTRIASLQQGVGSGTTAAGTQIVNTPSALPQR